jgi:hypothetical protein
MIGLIIYNLKNSFYSIVILKLYRSKNYGQTALKKFISIIKSKKMKLCTLVKKKNQKSVHIHDKISSNKKNYNKNFFHYKIL